jgi:hypothetical protein
MSDVFAFIHLTEVISGLIDGGDRYALREFQSCGHRAAPQSP